MVSALAGMKSNRVFSADFRAPYIPLGPYTRAGASGIFTGCCASVPEELFDAAKAGQVGRVQRLLRTGADPNATVHIWRTLDFPNKKNWLLLETTALLAAAAEGQVQTAQLLLVNGAAPDMTSSDGYTPLMRAAGKGRAAMLSLLVTHGASLESVHALTGSTALHFACVRDHPDCSELLVTLGCNEHARNIDGDTCKDLAARANYCWPSDGEHHSWHGDGSETRSRCWFAVFALLLLHLLVPGGPGEIFADRVDSVYRSSDLLIPESSIFLWHVPNAEGDPALRLGPSESFRMHADQTGRRESDVVLAGAVCTIPDGSGVFDRGCAELPSPYGNILTEEVEPHEPEVHAHKPDREAQLNTRSAVTQKDERMSAEDEVVTAESRQILPKGLADDKATVFNDGTVGVWQQSIGKLAAAVAAAAFVAVLLIWSKAYFVRGAEHNQPSRSERDKELEALRAELEALKAAGRVAKTNRAECCVCLEAYRSQNGSSESVVPRMLGCGHSFCEVCLAVILAGIEMKQKAKKLPCPECRKLHKVARGRVSSIPQNYALGA